MGQGRGTEQFSQHTVMWRAARPWELHGKPPVSFSLAEELLGVDLFFLVNL